MLKKVSKQILKIILWIVGVFIALDLLMVTLIIIPPVQQFILLRTSKLLTNITGGEITVDKIYLSPTLTLTAKNFAIKDHHHENMIFAENLKGRINISKTGNGQIGLSFAQLDVGEVILRKYSGEENVNIAIWAKGFKNDKKNEKKFRLLFDHIKLNDVRFVYINDDKREYKEDNTIDYAFFELQHIMLDVSNFLVLGADISCKINSLTLCQHTGFEISSFKGDFRIYAQGLTVDELKFTTPRSTFLGSFAFRYHDFKDYSDFVNLINFDTKINSASLDMQDIVYFAPAIKGMDNHLMVSGYVSGPVNHLKTKNLYVRYKLHTHIAGDFAMVNILDLKNDFQKCSFNLFLKDVNINTAELAQFKLPKNTTLNFQTDNVAWARIMGNFRGSLTKFNTNLTVQTNLGKVETEIKTSSIDSTISYSGTLAFLDWNLGDLVEQPKYLNKINIKSALEGQTNYKNFADISIGLRGKITNIEVCGYAVKDIDFNGNYKQKQANVTLHSKDSLLSFSAKSNLNFTKDIPVIDATLTHVTLKLNDYFSHYPYPTDSTSKNFEKLVWKIQQTPHLTFTLDSITIATSGNKLDNLNGFAAIDYARLTNGVRTSRIDWLRMTAINRPNLPHQFQIHSNAINASLKTNYNFVDCIAAIANAVDYYVPEMFYLKLPQKEITSTDTVSFIDFDLQLFYTQTLFNLLVPELNILRNSHLNVHFGTTRDEDSISINFPQVTYAGLGKVNNLNLNGKINGTQMFEIQMLCDSATLYQKEGGKLTFSNICLQTHSNQNEIQFAANWHNPKEISIPERNYFSGKLFENDEHNLSLLITDSKLFFRESLWQFTGNKNLISYGKDSCFLINHCILSSNIGKISVNGEISKKVNKECNIILENFDISLLNSLTAKLSMSFSGNMELMGMIYGNGNNFTIEGRTMVKDFVFNDEHLGNLYLDAIILEDGSPHFIGGILSNNKPLNIHLATFNYLHYLSLSNRIIELTGNWNTQSKALQVNAQMDTLKLGFLSPFLSSFSNKVSGNAAGELNFIMSKDSLYFDGKVKIRSAQLGIAPLNTVYYIQEQEILFNNKGIIFNQVNIKDKYQNNAMLSGYVHHNKFKDFKIDLNIETDRILALNTKKEIDASFFGNGFVSGSINIQGDIKQLNFISQNLTTLTGSAITFPVTSASSVSSSQGIHFVQSNRTSKQGAVEENKKSSTIMNFDFLFDITKDADVRLELDPIDGILQCKTAGKLHLRYNSKTAAMDLDGKLAIVSGNFHMSLRNFFPKNFTIVEGGTITFVGPLAAAQVNVSALYQKTASLNSLSPGLGRTDVAAYLGLNGSLTNPNPTFTFAFPRLTNEERADVFATLDTADQQNKIRQFFSFVFLNSFITAQSNVNPQQQSLVTGIDMVSGMINSLFSGQQNNINFGINYTNSQEMGGLGYQEYSVNAQVKFYNDKLMFRTNLGLGYDNDNTNSIAGDASMDIEINENWRLNFFYFNDGNANRNNIYNMNKPEQGGGVRLNFKHDFNNKKDFKEMWSIRNRPLH